MFNKHRNKLNRFAELSIKEMDDFDGSMTKSEYKELEFLEIYFKRIDVKILEWFLIKRGLIVRFIDRIRYGY